MEYETAKELIVSRFKKILDEVYKKPASTKEEREGQIIVAVTSKLFKLVKPGV